MYGLHLYSEIHRYYESRVLQKTTKHLFTLLRIGLAAALLIYLGRSGSIDWSSLTGLASAWQYTVMAALLFILGNLFLAWRLQILVNARALRLSFPAAFRLTFIGLFFNTYLPGATGGDIVKIYYASKGNPGQRTEVITILLLDRFIGLFCLLTLPLLLAPFFLDMIRSQAILQALLGASLLISTGIVVTVTIALMTGLVDSRLFLWFYEKLPLGDLLRRILTTVTAYRNNKIVILQAVMFSFMVQLLTIGVSLSIAEATNPLGADSKMIALIPLGFLANSLPVTPGGIGVGEAAMDNLFGLFSLDGGAELVLGWRLIMVLVGLMGLFFYLKGEKRFVFNKPQDS